MLFHKKEAEKDAERADLLAARLVGAAMEIATVITNRLGKLYDLRFRDSPLPLDQKGAAGSTTTGVAERLGKLDGLKFRNSPLPFVIEVVAFYLHLVDRNAFQYLKNSPKRRYAFTERLRARF